MLDREEFQVAIVNPDSSVIQRLATASSAFCSPHLGIFPDEWGSLPHVYSSGLNGLSSSCLIVLSGRIRLSKGPPVQPHAYVDLFVDMRPSSPIGVLAAVFIS
jgi:hypothetical protein